MVLGWDNITIIRIIILAWIQPRVQRTSKFAYVTVFPSCRVKFLESAASVIPERGVLARFGIYIIKPTPPHCNCPTLPSYRERFGFFLPESSVVIFNASFVAVAINRLLLSKSRCLRTWSSGQSEAGAATGIGTNPRGRHRHQRTCQGRRSGFLFYRIEKLL